MLCGLIRLPRVLLALAVGMALSVCGVVMQAIVQNPLADPYVLGISSGASLGATLAIMLGVGGFLGGNSVWCSCIYWCNGHFFCSNCHCKHGRKSYFCQTDPCRNGCQCGMFCFFPILFIYITKTKNAATEVMKWTMGSLAGASWSRVGVMLPVTLICVIIFWTQYRNLNLMLLGDDVSITLGTDLHRLRTFLSDRCFCNDWVCSILCGCDRLCRTCDPSCDQNPVWNRPQKITAIKCTAWCIIPDLV